MITVTNCTSELDLDRDPSFHSHSIKCLPSVFNLLSITFLSITVNVFTLKTSKASEKVNHFGQWSSLSENILVN